MKKLLLLLACLGATALAQSPAAQVPITNDAAGAKDHPIVGRHAGSFIVEQNVIDYDELDFPLSVLKRPPGRVLDESLNFAAVADKTRKVSGKRTRTVYLVAGSASPLEVVRNYQAELAAKGGKTLYECRQAECGKGTMAVSGQVNGGEEHSIPRYLWDSKRVEKAMPGKCAQKGTMDDSKFAIIEIPQGNTTLAVQSYRLLKSICKQWAGRTVAIIDVVEGKGLEQKMVTVSASEMHKAMTATGRVALYGIYFDSGKADVKPESATALAEIGKLMAANPSLKLLVVGHTDNNGDFDANMELSKRRAAAVVAALGTQHKVAANRLKPVGVSFASPVAANSSEDGRGRNRRVELVPQN
jgi:outer membrane protein OmpA-like peptidoglycan-associated protein